MILNLYTFTDNLLTNVNRKHRGSSLKSYCRFMYALNFVKVIARSIKHRKKDKILLKETREKNKIFLFPC
jgi:hypothetical protein